jgi:hypothetical protein
MPQHLKQQVSFTQILKKASSVPKSSVMMILLLVMVNKGPKKRVSGA